MSIEIFPVSKQNWIDTVKQISSKVAVADSAFKRRISKGELTIGSAMIKSGIDG